MSKTLRLLMPQWQGGNNPASQPSDFEGIVQGEMSFPQLSRLIDDVSQQTDLVGLSIAEYMPWDAINLKTLLGKFAILSDQPSTCA